MVNNMTKKEEQRLKEIKQEELELYYEKTKIFKKIENREKKLLFRRIESIIEKSEANIEDIRYIQKCSSNLVFSYHKDNMNIVLYEADLYISDDELNISYYKEGPSYEGAWGEMESDPVSDFDIILKIKNSMNIEYHCYNQNREIQIVFKENENTGEQINLLFTLDENKMEDCQ